MAIDGTYKVKVKTPVGVQEGALTLSTAGGTLSGRLDNAKGSTEFTGGTITGNAVAFATKIRTPMGRLKAQVNGVVEGDHFHGLAKLPLGTAEIDGERA
jgi:hypothetical protein